MQVGGESGGSHHSARMIIRASQGWYKPLPEGAAAVFIANHGFAPRSFTLDFGLVPGLNTTCSLGCNVTDVWAQGSGPSFVQSFTWTNLASHDSGFIVIRPAAQPLRVDE